ncbi:hypothetical protein ACIAD2717 [Acinetobacter baylyi ADP1]|uniref:Uncharacterized protein n=1 Tax=Acinetobacter baylyi (strain ATCC 33305 / BD413 / ADP1) TaxID=62977 RepID=Q6F8Z7_ACIAD|nr:hypothetical protein ACIAD2717 [Acinetobacter baylyi ADP1]
MVAVFPKIVLPYYLNRELVINITDILGDDDQVIDITYIYT